MITFNEKRLYVKGTCNVILSDPETGKIYLQDNKMVTGNINPSTNLQEIRAGLGNPIAAMIASDSNLTVEFESAAFSLWLKAAQLGTQPVYGAPVPKCQIAVAHGTTLSINVSGGTPVAEVGMTRPRCFIQEVGESSLVMTDGTAYPINEEGLITGFTAEEGKTYKVWYRVQNPSAQAVAIGSLIDPKLVRFEAQIAVFANSSGRNNQGTRVGWLYVTIPYLKLQGDGGNIIGDQTNHDKTKISGTAVAYDSNVVTEACDECGSSALAYYVYAPDAESTDLVGIAVVGGTVKVYVDGVTPVKVRFVMRDGSLVAPRSYSDGFTYTSSDTEIATVDESGLVTGVGQGDATLTISYTDVDGQIYICKASIVSEYGPYSSLVGYGQVGYMIVGEDPDEDAA